MQSVSHTLIFQVFFNITSVLEFVYSHFFTLYLICMWLLFIMPVIKLLFLTIVLPGDFVVARRAFWRETEMAILVARTNLPVWDFQKLASLALDRFQSDIPAGSRSPAVHLTNQRFCFAVVMPLPVTGHAGSDAYLGHQKTRCRRV